jgi:hypothetical protein
MPQLSYQDRKRRAKYPLPPVELVDPARIKPEVWNAGVDQWEREGHDPSTVPLEPRKWEALLCRRTARLREPQLKAQYEYQRLFEIDSLKPPKPSEVAPDGTSVCDAQNTYQKGREELSEENLKPKKIATSNRLAKCAPNHPRLSSRSSAKLHTAFHEEAQARARRDDARESLRNLKKSRDELLQRAVDAKAEIDEN